MDSRHPQPADRPPQRRVRKWMPLLGILAVPGLWGLWSGSWLAADRPSSPADPLAPADRRSEPKRVPSEGRIELAAHEALAPAEDSSPTGSEHPEPAVEQDQLQVVGDWEDDYQGKRHLTVRADGTATMVVEPSGIGRKLFADRLQFEIEWSADDGRIVMLTTGGEPESKTKLIMNLYGTRAEYKLLNLDDRQLLLLDADGKTKYDWRRVPGPDGKQ